MDLPSSVVVSVAVTQDEGDEHSPCHQPDELIEGDAAVTVLVHLSYQLLQLSL